MENPYSEFEFLTGLLYGDTEYVGIVVNSDNQLITFYDIGALPSLEAQKALLDLGDLWWWESNRQIPIDVFLHIEMSPFRPFIKTLVTKDTEVLYGPMISLQNLIRKRIKRRTVQLIKKVD